MFVPKIIAYVEVVGESGGQCVLPVDNPKESTIVTIAKNAIPSINHMDVKQ
jgi:hypothetical protein